MSELLIGTNNGVLRLGHDGNLQRQEGPPTVAFLTCAHEAVMVVTQEGALWRRTGADGWQLVHERPVTEDVWAFAADPRVPGRLYLGVSPALLYWSDDGGASWRACEAIRRIPGYERWTFPPPPHVPHVRSVVPDPQVVGAVYIGVEEGGIYRSTDEGETWESLNEGLYWDVHTVTPAPDGTRLYATTGRGFYRSDDGGEHWLRLGQGLPPQFDAMVRQVAVDDAETVYIAAGHELFGSHDTGESWQRLAGDLPTVQALAVV